MTTISMWRDDQIKYRGGLAYQAASVWWQTCRHYGKLNGGRQCLQVSWAGTGTDDIRAWTCNWRSIARGERAHDASNMVMSCKTRWPHSTKYRLCVACLLFRPAFVQFDYRPTDTATEWDWIFMWSVNLRHSSVCLCAWKPPKVGYFLL